MSKRKIHVEKSIDTLYSLFVGIRCCCFSAIVSVWHSAAASFPEFDSSLNTFAALISTHTHNILNKSILCLGWLGSVGGEKRLENYQMKRSSSSILSNRSWTGHLGIVSMRHMTNTTKNFSTYFLWGPVFWCKNAIVVDEMVSIAYFWLCARTKSNGKIHTVSPYSVLPKNLTDFLRIIFFYT